MTRAGGERRRSTEAESRRLHRSIPRCPRPRTPHQASAARVHHHGRPGHHRLASAAPRRRRCPPQRNEERRRGGQGEAERQSGSAGARSTRTSPSIRVVSPSSKTSSPSSRPTANTRRCSTRSPRRSRISAPSRRRCSSACSRPMRSPPTAKRAEAALAARQKEIDAEKKDARAGAHLGGSVADRGHRGTRGARQGLWSRG